MCSLTEKQKAIVRFIYSFQYDFNMAPSVYEIGNHFGLKIPSVFAHLESLLKKRVITKDSKARSIRLIQSNEYVQSLKIPSFHKPCHYSIPVLTSPVYKNINNNYSSKINDYYNFDCHVYHKLTGEYGVYALLIDQYNQYLSTGLNLNDLLLINPDVSFIVKDSIILASISGKLSIYRCLQWKYGIYQMIPWGNDIQRDSASIIKGEQADLNIFGTIIGLHRAFSR